MTGMMMDSSSTGYLDVALPDWHTMCTRWEWTWIFQEKKMTQGSEQQMKPLALLSEQSLLNLRGKLC